MRPRLLFALLGAAALSVAAAGASETAIFPLSEVRPGLAGYGLSVFSGIEPQRFEVEVVGVLQRVSPGTSYVLARLSGQGLERTGRGMSGSPVTDGRLAGQAPAYRSRKRRWRDHADRDAIPPPADRAAAVALPTS